MKNKYSIQTFTINKNDEEFFGKIQIGSMIGIWTRIVAINSIQNDKDSFALTLTLENTMEGADEQ
jgi:hypothetical protein